MQSTVRSSHLSQVWRWKGLAEGDMPGAKVRLHNLDPAHAFKLTRDPAGIWMQWKQRCTDETWSQPVQILKQDEIHKLGRWRPDLTDMQFPSGGQPNLDWLSKLEAWCSTQPGASNYHGLEKEFAWLRAAIRHELPGTYAPGKHVEELLQTMRGLSHGRAADDPSREVRTFPQDVIAQLFPGADIPNLPPESLVRIEGVTHNANGRVRRPDTIYPGSLVLIRAPDDAMAHGQALQLAVGMVIDATPRRGDLPVAWYVPELSRMENFRSGSKKNVLDVFGPWAAVSELSHAVLKTCRLPPGLVDAASVLECNFDLDDESCLPYDVFDALRTRHSIDLSGFNSSFTQRGNKYRNYVLMRGT